VSAINEQKKKHTTQNKKQVIITLDVITSIKDMFLNLSTKKKGI